MIHIDSTTKEISMNRGDRATIKLKAAEEQEFEVGKTIKFSIVEKGDYNKVKFQKTYTVSEASDEFLITLLPDDTRFSDIISKGQEFWYEIEYDGKYTVIGFDSDKAKKFILYPEAPEKESE